MSLEVSWHQQITKGIDSQQIDHHIDPDKKWKVARDLVTSRDIFQDIHLLIEGILT